MSRNKNPKVDVSWKVNDYRVPSPSILLPLLWGWQCFYLETCLKLKAGTKSWGMECNNVWGKWGMVVPLRMRGLFLQARRGCSSQAGNKILKSPSIGPGRVWIPQENPDFISTLSTFPYFLKSLSRSDWRASYSKFPQKMDLIVPEEETNFLFRKRLSKGRPSRARGWRWSGMRGGCREENR